MQVGRAPAAATGDEVRVVEVVDWSPAWQQAFEAAAAELAAVLPGDPTIEHVGSTSVPGLPAKPTVDILVVTTLLDELRKDPTCLVSLGYQPRPHAFADDCDHLFFIRETDHRRSEHLHVFGARSPRPQSNRDFRDYLIAHPDEARRYADAKRASAATHPDSRGEYGRGKEQVFSRLLAAAAEGARTGVDDQPATPPRGDGRSRPAAGPEAEPPATSSAASP
jgi:GrpB-like predicted nucleotidyltransferase (UPF0157 family)